MKTQKIIVIVSTLFLAAVFYQLFKRFRVPKQVAFAEVPFLPPSPQKIPYQLASAWQKSGWQLEQKGDMYFLKKGSEVFHSKDVDAEKYPQLCISNMRESATGKKCLACWLIETSRYQLNDDFKGYQCTLVTRRYALGKNPTYIEFGLVCPGTKRGTMQFWPLQEKLVSEIKKGETAVTKSKKIDGHEKSLVKGKNVIEIPIPEIEMELADHPGKKYLQEHSDLRPNW